MASFDALLVVFYAIYSYKRVNKRPVIDPANQKVPVSDPGDPAPLKALSVCTLYAPVISVSYCPALVLRSEFVNCMYFIRANKMNERMS